MSCRWNFGFLRDPCQSPISVWLLIGAPADALHKTLNHLDVFPAGNSSSLHLANFRESLCFSTSGSFPFSKTTNHDHRLSQHNITSSRPHTSTTHQSPLRPLATKSQNAFDVQRWTRWQARLHPEEGLRGQGHQVRPPRTLLPRRQVEQAPQPAEEEIRPAAKCYHEH